MEIIVYSVLVLFFIGLLSGFILFNRNTITPRKLEYAGNAKVSIIIPARNEEKNLPVLLQSLREQSIRPHEIIVVDDCSDDRTREIAESFGVTVIDNPRLPAGWTGKTWAVWNGYLQATGDVLAFFDADIKLAPNALESILLERERCGGVISVVPFHTTKKFYERLALLTNILGIFAFTSPFQQKSIIKGLYGSCIVTTRVDYEKINGHQSIKAEVLDDMNLGAKFSEAGIAVNNFIGGDLVSFRMYPNGFKSELEGFAKSAILGTAKMRKPTIALIVFWLVGLIVSEAWIFFFSTPLFYPLLVGYLLYTAQILWWIRSVGYFGFVMPLLHILSTVFFLIMMVYSAYQVVFLKAVVWKGRNVEVGRNREL